MDPIFQGHIVGLEIFLNRLGPILVSRGMYPRIVRRHGLEASDLFDGSFRWRGVRILRVPIIPTEYSTRSYKTQKVFWIGGVIPIEWGV